MRSGVLCSSLCLDSSSFLLVSISAMSQFSPFEVGQVKAHMHHGLGAQRISGILERSVGGAPQDPLWDGL